MIKNGKENKINGFTQVEKKYVDIALKNINMNN